MEKRASEIVLILQNGVSFPSLEEWNEQLEEYWKMKQPDDDDSATEKSLVDDEQVVHDASIRLFSVFVSVYEGMTIDDAVNQFSTECDKERIDRLYDTLSCENDEGDDDSWRERVNGEEFSEVTRAASNYLRWYLQIYQPIMSTQSEVRSSVNLISAWQSRAFLQLLLQLLSVTSRYNSQVCRNLSQLLFFATYSAIPGTNPILDETYLWLVKELDLMSTLLSGILNSTANNLTLSLLRNIHNALVSFPGTTIYVMQTKVKVPATTQTKLAVSLEGEETVDYLTLLKQLALLCLESAGPQGFSGEQQTQEVLIEVLRIMYALRVGTRLPGDQTLVDMVNKLLRLNPVVFGDCQSPIVTILMDSDPSFADHVVANGQVKGLLDILDKKLEVVVEQNQVDNAGAASLTPILVVLYKYSQSNADFLQFTKEFVFPPQDQDKFVRLVQEYREDNIRRGGKGNNMSPLDAPPGTVRFKLIRLLTWPNSHIKRFAGELLWILCDKDPQQFTYRVGFGNGLPILSLKGFASIPGHTTSSTDVN